MMDNKKRIKYLEDPTGCPFCGSGKIQLNNTPIHIYKDRSYQKMYCEACGYKWEDVYQLVNVIEAEEEDSHNDYYCTGGPIPLV